jgi:FkbM family methyltransferase
VNTVERIARWLKYSLGFKDTSGLIVALRPGYNRFLDLLYGKRGLIRTLDGVESILIRPAYRNFRDDFEPALFRFLRRAVRSGNAVIEVGANVGIFTVAMARWVGPKGHIFAFEPSPTARAALEDHLALNGVGDRVSVVAAAVSDAVGKSLFYEFGTSGQNTLSPTHSRIPEAKSVVVDVTTLDSFCDSNKIVPSLVKVDIEGFELHAIRGARKTLRDHAPVLVVELHPMNWLEIGASGQDLGELLAEIGYCVEALEGQGDPFSEYGHVVFVPKCAGSLLGPG